MRRLVQVYDGTVFAQVKGERETDVSGEQVTSGQARFLDGASGSRLRPLPFVSDRFLRTFPVPRRRHGPDVPYNQSRFDAVHIFPTLSGITIDGDLSDWDRHRMFRSACIAPYDANYYVEGMMMYDAEYLYIGGHVGDPYPLRNRVDHSTDPSFFWAGGSVVVRLSTDKALGWPLQGIRGGHPRAERLRVLAAGPWMSASESFMWVYGKRQPDRKATLVLGIRHGFAWQGLRPERMARRLPRRRRRLRLRLRVRHPLVPSARDLQPAPSRRLDSGRLARPLQ